MRKLKFIWLLLTLLCIVYSLPAESMASETISFPITVEEDYDMANELLELINAHRRELGVTNSLQMDAKLQDIAMQRAAELVVSFDHYRPDGSRTITASYPNVWGENIGAGAGQAKLMFDTWKSSTLHGPTMNDKYSNYCGIGCVYYEGTRYWVLNTSADPMGPVSAAAGTARVQRTITLEKSKIVFQIGGWTAEGYGTYKNGADHGLYYGKEAKPNIVVRNFYPEKDVGTGYWLDNSMLLFSGGTPDAAEVYTDGTVVPLKANTRASMTVALKADPAVNADLTFGVKSNTGLKDPQIELTEIGAYSIEKPFVIPRFNVTDCFGNLMKEGRDYYIEYRDNNILENAGGIAYAYIWMKGNYTCPEYTGYDFYIKKFEMPKKSEEDLPDTNKPEDSNLDPSTNHPESGQTDAAGSEMPGEKESDPQDETESEEPADKESEPPGETDPKVPEDKKPEKKDDSEPETLEDRENEEETPSIPTEKESEIPGSEPDGDEPGYPDRAESEIPDDTEREKDTPELPDETYPNEKESGTLEPGLETPDDKELETQVWTGSDSTYDMHPENDENRSGLMSGSGSNASGCNKAMGNTSKSPDKSTANNAHNTSAVMSMVAHLARTSYTYNGKTHKPDITVYVNGFRLSTSEYTVSYKNNKTVGIVKVVVTGRGTYAGLAAEATFRIKLKKPSFSKLKSSSKKKLTVQWTKDTQAGGYQIQYALNKKFTKSRITKTISGNGKTSVKLKKLKSKRTYYIRIRTYKKVNGKIWYSPWSKAKKVKIK